MSNNITILFNAILSKNRVDHIILFGRSKNNYSFYYPFNTKQIDGNQIINNEASIDLSNDHKKLYIKLFQENGDKLKMIGSSKFELNEDFGLNKTIGIKIKKTDEISIKPTDLYSEKIHNIDNNNNMSSYTLLIKLKVGESSNKRNEILNNNNFVYYNQLDFIAEKSKNFDNKNLIAKTMTKENLINFILLRYLKKAGSVEEYIKTYYPNINLLKNKKISVNAHIEEYLGGKQLIKYTPHPYNSRRIISPISGNITIFDGFNLKIKCGESYLNLQNILDKDFFIGSMNPQTININISLQDLRRFYQPYTAKLYKITKPKLCDKFEVLVFHYTNEYHSPESHKERDFGSFIYGHVRQGCECVSKPLPNKKLNFKMVFLSPVKRATVLTRYSFEKLSKGKWINQGFDMGFVGLSISNILIISNREFKIDHPINKYSTYSNDINNIKMPTQLNPLEEFGEIL